MYMFISLQRTSSIYFIKYFLTIINIDACDVTLSVYPHQTSLKNMPGHSGKPGIFFKLVRCGYTLRVTSQASY
jgi:hypothetical protein